MHNRENPTNFHHQRMNKRNMTMHIPNKCQIKSCMKVAYALLTTRPICRLIKVIAYGFIVKIITLMFAICKATIGIIQQQQKKQQNIGMRLIATDWLRKHIKSLIFQSITKFKKKITNTHPKCMKIQNPSRYRKYTIKKGNSEAKKVANHVVIRENTCIKQKPGVMFARGKK